MKLASRKGRTGRLEGVLEKIRGIDTVVIDCPPSLSLLTVNALACSDYVIIPTRATAMDIQGIHLLTDTVEAVRDNLNPALEIMGVLITFYHPRLIHSREIMERLQEMDLRIFDAKIGQSIRVAEPIGRSVVRYAPRNKRAQEYIQFGAEVKEWLDRK
jgi:chromosome partitioning protein